MTRVYYADGSRLDVPPTPAKALPRDGVQVVVVMEPYPNAPYPGWTPWAGARPDRQVWTGEDEYKVGRVKLRGSLIPDSDYQAIFARAITEE